MAKQLKIYYPDGSFRIVNPSPQFDGKYKDLAIALSGGERVRWVIT